MRHENRLKQYRENFAVLLPDQADKDASSRLLFFVEWLEEQHLPWYRPQLARYAHYLQYERVRPDKDGDPMPAPLSLATVQAHLATIRGRYRALLSNNAIRQRLYDALPQGLAPADRKAAVDELLIRLENDIHPRHTPLESIEVRDEADADHLRLTPAQVRALVRAPGVSTLSGLRDTTLIALLVCTGIREAEAVALQVDDLRQSLGGELALRVRAGKGGVQRLVPYGPLDWCLIYAERWLEEAQISGGALLRGIYKGEKRIRPTPLTARAVNQIMQRHPIPIEGVLTCVQPHDLRRTYARNAYLHGMDMERIRQNLGHASVQTTQVYIGTLDGHQRLPPDMFPLPHSSRELASPLKKAKPRRRPPQTP